MGELALVNPHSSFTHLQMGSVVHHSGMVAPDDVALQAFTRMLVDDLTLHDAVAIDHPAFPGKMFVARMNVIGTG